MPRIIFTVFICLLTGFVSVSNPAHAGKKEDIAALQSKVTRLEQQLGSLSQQTGQTNADATLKISQLQRENQQLTGQVEQLSNQVSQMQARLDQVTRILAGETFSGLETNPASSAFGPATGQLNGQVTPDAAPLGSTPFGATTQDGANGNGPIPLGGTSGDAQDVVTGSDGAQAQNAATSGVQLPTDPDAAYAYASNFLLTGDYIKARDAFEQYVQAFPNSVHTPDARFRLGEIYLATGANADAAKAFIGHIRDYPSNTKSAEAHLKLGTAFARMEQTDQACQIYKQVRIKFPNASQIVLSRTELEMQRINCR